MNSYFLSLRNQFMTQKPGERIEEEPNEDVKNP